MSVNEARFRTLLFDVGSTLVFPNWQLISEELARDDVHLAPDVLAAREPHARHALDNEAFVARTNDRSRWDDYFGGIVRQCGVPGFPPGALARLRIYDDAHNLWEHVPPEVPGVLSALRRRGCRLGAVSNSNGSVQRKLTELGLAGSFEVVLDSAVEGIEKPDPRLFLRALQRMGVRTEHATYVGDIYHVDVVGARAAGLQPILVDPCGLHADKPCRRIATLEELLDLVSVADR
ncbi:MAG TPA: HAD family hydrolase [Planctomycetota bacterium]|nr:HAD family hydrolase [Planctomycetota bacterium]